MSNLFAPLKVAGLDEYELRWGLQAMVNRRLEELEPKGPAGQALVFEFLAGQARRLFRDAVLAMRAGGLSWEAIAGELGRAEPGEAYESAMRVFESVAILDSWDCPYARWLCPACDGVVNERFGEYAEGNPIDDQPGHQPGCPRQAEAMAIWEAKWADQ